MLLDCDGCLAQLLKLLLSGIAPVVGLRDILRLSIHVPSSHEVSPKMAHLYGCCCLVQLLLLLSSLAEQTAF